MGMVMIQFRPVGSEGRVGAGWCSAPRDRHTVTSNTAYYGLELRRIMTYTGIHLKEVIIQ